MVQIEDYKKPNKISKQKSIALIQLNKDKVYLKEIGIETDRSIKYMLASQDNSIHSSEKVANESQLRCQDL